VSHLVEAVPLAGAGAAAEDLIRETPEQKRAHDTSTVL
jgi:hypothetical protein